MLVYLSEKGRAEIDNTPAGGDIDFLGCLTEDEQKNLESYLDRMIQYLESALGEESEGFAEHMKKVSEERERIFGQGFPNGFGGKFPDGFPQGFGGMEGALTQMRGQVPEGMPGAERFSPDYDGPIPDRSEFFPFTWGTETKNDEEKE
jgi:hypothetical protein